MMTFHSRQGLLKWVLRFLHGFAGDLTFVIRYIGRSLWITPSLVNLVYALLTAVIAVVCSFAFARLGGGLVELFNESLSYTVRWLGAFTGLFVGLMIGIAIVISMKVERLIERKEKDLGQTAIYSSIASEASVWKLIKGAIYLVTITPAAAFFINILFIMPFLLFITDRTKDDAIYYGFIISSPIAFTFLLGLFVDEAASEQVKQLKFKVKVGHKTQKSLYKY